MINKSKVGFSECPIAVIALADGLCGLGGDITSDCGNATTKACELFSWCLWQAHFWALCVWWRIC